MLNKVKHIIIFGGGTSGWLSAAYLVANLNTPTKITLIESSEIGPIGVGEGTQPATARFLYDAGLLPKTWMKPSNASFKLGVEFEGWTDENFFIENDFIENTVVGPGVRTVDYFVDRPAKEYFDWMPAYQFAKNNVSPKLAHMDTNFSVMHNKDFGAVHFNAFDILSSLKELIGDRISYFDTKIIDVKKDNNGITGLVDQEGRMHTADLYLDCTGFASVLIEKTLDVPFDSIEGLLPCNRAVMIPTQYKDPEQECFPYTKATAMDAGWRFTIPTFNRIGNGYVYSDKFITPEQAEQELRDALGEPDLPAKHLKMKCGAHRSIAHKNVVAVGLAAGFVEPLEATSITFTTKIVEVLTKLLNKNYNVWSDTCQKGINVDYNAMVLDIITFVWIHYHYSTKNNTPFWQAIHAQDENAIPQAMKDIIGSFEPLHDQLYLQEHSGFHVGNWFSILKAGGRYKNATSKLTEDQKKYVEFYLDNHKYRVKKASQVFKNHYQYLKDWYNSEM